MQSSIIAVPTPFTHLVYEFTSDPAYMEQYGELVKQFYKKDLKLDLEHLGMDKELYALAPNEHLFIVRHGHQVVGGAKLSFSSRKGHSLLPMESDDFRVSSILPEDYTNLPYAEIGRLVVSPDFRGKDVLAQMVQELARFTLQQGGGYLFVLAPPLNAVLYRRVCKGLHMDVVQHKGVEWGSKQAYQHLQLQLLSCDIRELQANGQQEPAADMAIAV